MRRNKGNSVEEMERKIKSGEWQTFNIQFFAQWSNFNINDCVVVVAAPDYKAALAQFQNVISKPGKQLVAVITNGHRDVAFLDLHSAEAIILKPPVNEDTKPEEEMADKQEAAAVKECECNGECECQKQEEQTKA